jgi:alkanesulfonate monooxygenase SsuD/methylene tetrahydromethanopterin reductase-like flavin-dependent oxidoreductase (luciferase family)
MSLEFSISLPQTHPDPARIARFLPRAEALGYDAAWAIEQVIGAIPSLESVTTLGYAAALTRSMRLGVAVLIVAQRSPIPLAKALSTVDVLSGGRLIVGVGLGGDRFYPAYGLTADARVARFRENLEVMRRLWTEERVTLNGRFQHLERIAMEPKPLQKPHPPLWFGGHAEPALARAVELGDGFIGAGSSTMEAFLSEVASLRAKLGGRTDFPIGKRLYLSLDDNLPRMREWFGAFYRNPELADQVAVWGSAEKIREAVARLREAGVSHVLLHPVVDEEEQMERLAAEVIPHFR